MARAMEHHSRVATYTVAILARHSALMSELSEEVELFRESKAIIQCWDSQSASQPSGHSKEHWAALSIPAGQAAIQ